MAPWKSIKPTAGQDQKHFSPYGKAVRVSILLISQWDSGPAWPLKMNTQKSGFLLSEGGTESEPSGSKSFLAESPDFWHFIYSLVRLSIKN